MAFQSFTTYQCIQFQFQLYFIKQKDPSIRRHYLNIRKQLLARKYGPISVSGSVRYDFPVGEEFLRDYHLPYHSDNLINTKANVIF